jgi:phosphoenolpyruvate-protein phosphotransferase (PTS system enzyme I)
MKMRVDVAGLAYRGRTASIGFARGPFIRIGSGAGRERSPGSPAEEALALRDAIRLSSEQIAELAAAAGGEAAQILEFQVALLEDEDFLQPVFATIDQGVPADSAWSSALDQQIADYTSASDEYLQARSSDLNDLRDRVRRRSAAVPVSGDRLVRWWRAGAAARQPHEPRGDAGARARDSDGRATGAGPRRRRCPA